MPRFRLCSLGNSTPVWTKNFSTKFNLSGTSTTYVEEIYNKWCQNPTSVHGSWNAYFSSDHYYSQNRLKRTSMSAQQPQQVTTSGTATNIVQKQIKPEKPSVELHLKVQSIIRSYQQRGHLVADLDPLGIITHPLNTEAGITRRGNDSVTRHYFDFEPADMNREFQLPDTTKIGGSEKTLKLGDIIQRLENVYCNKIGLEYMYIPHRDVVAWIRERFEMPGVRQFSNAEKILILNRLTRATKLESFLAKKYSSEKRFGLEGCEMLVPAMKQIIDRASEGGVESFLIGMAHRGRLNVLANVCRKPLHTILTQFAGLKATDSGSGDVKYHLGTFIERINRQSNKNIRLAIVANASHLEAVNPVVQGKTRAEQFYRGDSDGKRVMSILIHGDASNCGQGIVYETMHLSDLPDYTTHGTIHLVVNNQIGFTTDPRFSRSSPYCTDVAKVVNAPIFHVNADDPESVIHCCNVAADWRKEFHKDVVIDLVCYRRNGHNEIDEPMFTQPLMYQRIKGLKTCMDLYVTKLIKEGVTNAEEVKKYADKYEAICNQAFEDSQKETCIQYKDWLDSPWSGFFEGKDRFTCPTTGVNEETLTHIGNVFSSLPPNGQDFVIHKGIERILGARKQMVEQRVADWAFAEAFAFGSLLKDGIHVRLSGQDVERGTFSHRHHVLHHQTTDKALYRPLSYLYPDQAKYSVCNSSLSESGVLGFEHGYSMSSPNCLVIWEGQFGDFCNNAQCIIDQFIASGETKWVRQSGLVMLLPHGLEGMGPEHSSCRLERFLQSSDDDPDTLPDLATPTDIIKQLSSINWIVANCSTPANLFHILRRQILLPFRKPLVIATPKSGLRLSECKSSFDDMIEGTEFQRAISETGPIASTPDNVKRLVFCTGKTYYDLCAARSERNKTGEVAISRIEQLCPFPYDLFIIECEKYPNADVIWAQEEHKNQGCWPYLQTRMSLALQSRCLYYHGRGAAAAPATGSKHQYLKEQEEYLEGLFGAAVKDTGTKNGNIVNHNENKENRVGVGEKRKYPGYVSNSKNRKILM